MPPRRSLRVAVLGILLSVAAISCLEDDPAEVEAMPEDTVTAPAEGVTATPEPAVPTVTVPAMPERATPTTTPTAPHETPTRVPTVSRTPASSPTTASVAIPQVDADVVVSQLLAGGYVLYVRPVDARTAEAGTPLERPDDCASRRILTPAGEAQAREFGVAWQQLGLPLGAVLVSDDCQALETARIAGVPYGTATGLSVPLDSSGTSDARVTGLLNEQPEDGTNTLLVGHQLNAGNAVGIQLAAPGDMAVFRPQDAGAELVAVIPAAAWLPVATARSGPRFQQYPVPAGTRPHDVAPATDGGIWYTAQYTGELGWLDPVTGESVLIPLGAGSAPHGVIVGGDGAAWITDGGLNAIVRVDADTHEVTTYPLPPGSASANLNTAAFDGNGMLWFTGQAGIYGRVNPATGEVQVWDAPRGRGPYGIAATPDGDIYYASLAGSHIARIDPASGDVTVIEPPTADQGARRVWSDSSGHIWVSEWNSGQVSVYDPVTGEWQQWRLPGERPQTYAVYVDDRDIVWLSDFAANTLVRFAPATETFESFPLPATPSNVRQILGRPHEVWGAESAADTLVVLRVP